MAAQTATTLECLFAQDVDPARPWLTSSLTGCMAAACFLDKAQPPAECRRSALLSGRAPTAPARAAARPGVRPPRPRPAPSALARRPCRARAPPARPPQSRPGPRAAPARPRAPSARPASRPRAARRTARPPALVQTRPSRTLVVPPVQIQVCTCAGLIASMLHAPYELLKQT